MLKSQSMICFRIFLDINVRLQCNPSNVYVKIGIMIGGALRCFEIYAIHIQKQYNLHYINAFYHQFADFNGVPPYGHNSLIDLFSGSSFFFSKIRSNMFQSTGTLSTSTISQIYSKYPVRLLLQHPR